MRLAQVLPALLVSVAAATCDFDRVDGSHLSAQEFRDRFRTGPLSAGKPVIFTNVRLGAGLSSKEKRGKGAPPESLLAAERRGASPFGPGWDPQVLEASLGHSMVRSQQVVVYRYEANASRPSQTGLGQPAPLESIMALRDSTLFLLKPLHPASQALGDVLELPGYLRPIQLTGPTLSIGSTNASSPPHQHQENWFAQLLGQKAWVVAPPDDQEAARTLKADKPCDLWYQREKLAKVKKLKSCLLDAGEVVYLPSQWHHGTCNVGEFSVGLGYIGALDHLPKVSWAAAFDDVPGLQEALKAVGDTSAALSVKDREGKEPLHWAAHTGHRRMVRELLQLRANPDGRDNHGARASHLAAFEGKEKALRVLLEDHRRLALARTSGGAEPIHLAATRGHTSIAKLLLSKKASPSARDNKGAEPLHMAAYEGHLAMVDLLLASGAAPDAGSDDGTEPAKLAFARGHKDLAQKLKDATPKPERPAGRKSLGPLHEEF